MLADKKQIILAGMNVIECEVVQLNTYILQGRQQIWR